MAPGPSHTPNPDRHAEFAGASEDLVRLNHLVTLAHTVPGVTHELNNVLQVVGGYVELLAARTDLPADARTRLEKVGAQVARATALVTDLLEFSRGSTTERIPLDLGKAIDRAVAFSRYDLTRAGVSVTVEPSAAAVVARANPQELHHALLQVIRHAMTALAGRSGAGLVLAAYRSTTTSGVRVEANLPGMTRAAWERLFEPVQTERGMEVAGAGPCVLVDILGRHGGTVRIEDAQEEGSVLCLELPASAALDFTSGLP